MMQVAPIYKILLAIAITAYIICSCIMQADMYNRIGELEHKLIHPSCTHEK